MRSSAKNRKAVPAHALFLWLWRSLSVGVVLVCVVLAQQGDDSSLLMGTVRDGKGTAVANATVQLESKGGAAVSTAQTDAKGAYRFPAVLRGVYSITVKSDGYNELRIDAVLVSPKETKMVDLTVGAPTNAGPASTRANQPQFFDPPQFTVAGVTDTTNLGGHGSDVVVRTREGLAKETVSLGMASADAGAAPDAATERALRERADRDPNNFEANRRLGRWLVENGKSRAAIPYLERAGKHHPDDYENSYDLALANAESGNYERARQEATNLIAAHDKAEVHHLLGKVAESAGNPLDAVRQYQRAVELDPRESYLFDWGSELLLHHAAEPAGEVFTKGNRMYPRSVRMLLGLGAAIFARGSTGEAVRTICQASDLNPEDPAPYLFLGKMQRAESTPAPEVVDRLRRFAQHQPENAQANYDYAVALWKRGKAGDEAGQQSAVEPLLRKVLQLDPRFAAADLQLGILEAEGGNNSAAIADYQRAIGIDPQMEEAHFRLARAYRQSGEDAKAKAELQLYEQCAKESTQKIERERHEIRQFVYTLRDAQSPAIR